jgi:hypothetical protein
MRAAVLKSGKQVPALGQGTWLWVKASTIAARKSQPCARASNWEGQAPGLSFLR